MKVVYNKCWLRNKEGRIFVSFGMLGFRGLFILGFWVEGSGGGLEVGLGFRRSLGNVFSCMEFLLAFAVLRVVLVFVGELL